VVYVLCKQSMDGYQIAFLAMANHLLSSKFLFSDLQCLHSEYADVI